VTDWSVLGGELAPGNVAAILASSAKLRSSASHAVVLKGSLERIQRSSQSLRWHGEGGDAFRARLKDIPHYLGILTDSHEELSVALRNYAGTLEGLQSWAAQVIQLALKAQADGANARQNQAAAAGRVRDASTRRDAAHRAAATALSLWNRYQHSPGADPNRTALLHQQWVTDQRFAAKADMALANARAEQEFWRKRVADADERSRIANSEAGKIREQALDARRATRRRVAAAANIRIPEDPLLQQFLSTAVEVLRPNSATETYLRFLSGLSQTAQWIGMIPIPALSLVMGTIATALEIVILVGRIQQAAYGQRPWTDVAKDAGEVVITAASMIPMSKALEKSSLLGQAKRGIWYDDARHAVGDWRKVKVAPKLMHDLLRHYPELSPTTVYRVGIVLHWTNEAADAADNVARVADFGYGVYYNMKGRSWDEFPDVVSSHAVDAVYGDATAEHLKAATEAALDGNVSQTVDQSARALVGDQTTDAVIAAVHDAVDGDAIKAIGDLGD